MRTDQSGIKPVIFVVGEESNLKKRIVDYYLKLDFKVVDHFFSDLNSIQQETYRVILIINFLEDFEKINRGVINNLINLREKLLIIGLLSSKIEIIGDEIGNINLINKSQDDLISVLSPILVNSKKIFGLNVLSNDKKIHYPLKLLFERIHQKQIIDPELAVPFQTEEDFFKILEKELIKPIEEKQYLILGEVVQTSALAILIKNLYQKYFQKDLLIKKILTKTTNWDGMTLVKISDQNLEKYFDIKIRSLPLFEKNRNFELKQNKINFKDRRRQSINKVVHGFLDGSKAVEIIKNDKLVFNKKLIAKLPDEEFVSDFIEKDIEKIFQKKRSNKNLSRLKTGVEEVKIVKQKNKKKRSLFYGGLSILLIGGVGLLLFFILTVSTFFAKKEIVRSIDSGGKSGVWINMLSFQTDLYLKFLDKKLLKEPATIVEYSKISLEMSNFDKKNKELIGKIAVNILAKNAGIAQLIEESENIILAKNAGIKLLKEKANNFNWVLFNKKNILIEDYLTDLDNQEKQLKITNEFYQTLPTWLGIDKISTVLIVLQNDLEIRPTGGVIQAAYLLTFKNGLITDYELIRVNEIDQNLPGNISSPKDMKLFLDQGNWSFKDGGWQVSADEALKTIGWFVSEATNKQITGVIGLSYSAFGELLKTSGSLSIPNISYEIDSFNLLEKAEDQALVGNVFAEQVLQAFILQLKSKSASELVEILSATRSLIESNQVLLFLNNSTDEEIIKKIGWSGEVVTPSCPAQLSSENCFIDQIYQVDSNVGLNLANSQTTRKITQKIGLNNDGVTHLRTVIYHNATSIISWPMGIYKNYIRFVLPKTVTNEKILINNQEVSLENMVNYFEGDNKIVGVLAEVGLEEVLTLQLMYEQPFIVKENQSYVFFNQKQPGTKDEVYEIYVRNDAKPSIIAPNAGIKGNLVGFSIINAKNAVIGIKY